MDYQDFLTKKQIRNIKTGFDYISLPEKLFPFQRDIARWSCLKGRSALFADCGMGKTPMQLSWADNVVRYENKPVLILAPLAVAKQTQIEGEKFGIEVNLCESHSDIKTTVNITNYEKLHRFDPALFCGIVLDESSILKSFTGKTRNAIINCFDGMKYKLACTATPAPNDYTELGNHSEFLGALTRSEMLSMFFINDTSNVGQWRLKGHAWHHFWQWVCSWATMIRKPSDLGYDDWSFQLPKLNIIPQIVESNYDPHQFGELFMREASTLSERRDARKMSLGSRVGMAADLANNSDEQWLIWCDMNAESAMLTKSIPDAVEVTGSNTPEHKENAMLDFAAGKIRVLVSKPSIAGWGMNFQSCHNMAFVGLSDSYEAFYQAVRRCWRFGQESEVNAHIIYSEREGAVVSNIKRKEYESEVMASSIVKYMSGITKSEIIGASNNQIPYIACTEITIPGWLQEA